MKAACELDRRRQVVLFVLGQCDELRERGDIEVGPAFGFTPSMRFNYELLKQENFQASAAEMSEALDTIRGWRDASSM